MAVGGVNTFRLGAGTVAAGASVPEAGFMGALTTGTLATFTGFSLDYTLEGSSQLFGQFDHLEGQKVLDSYIEPTESYLVETEKKVFLDAMLGMMWYGTSKVVNKVVQTAPVQKVVAKVVEKVEQQPWGAMRHGAPGERPGSGVGAKAKAVPAKNMVQSKGKDGSVKTSKTSKNASSFTTAEIRAVPGQASGGNSLSVISEGDKWMRGTHANAAKMPKQIADKMRGQQFKNWDDFRKTVWKHVAEDSVLSKNFGARDLADMHKGLAPRVHKTQSIGDNAKYNIHHKTPINQGGEVYDFDNLYIVTPKFHKEVLDKAYHGGK